MTDSITRADHSDAVITDYLEAQEHKSHLRFLTCGSVDDGKSTLIGRLLYDAKTLFEDQISQLHQDSRNHGTAGDDIDFALLVDGLEAEREQGITIDVAYRFFATPKRRFIVADTPGHLQYTRNMVTGASTADLAIVLVDARKGLLEQTRRHSFIASLLGIRHIVLAVNKIDLTGYDETVFNRIVQDYQVFAQGLGFSTVQAIPVSARFGDNIRTFSENMPWYQGPSLLEWLETVAMDSKADTEQDFRFPVQYVSRPHADFRGFAGTIASGQVSVGDEITVARSGVSSAIRYIVTADGELETAHAGQAVTLVLEDERDISRGDMLTHPQSRPQVSDRLAAKLVWFAPEPLRAGRQYWLRSQTDQVSVTVNTLNYRIDIENTEKQFAQEPADQLQMNEIGQVALQLSAPLAFDPYGQNRATGSFILIDRLTNATVAAGLIDHSLRKASHIHVQAAKVTPAERAEQKYQKPTLLWFTGLSGSGKSALATVLEQRLHLAGKHTFILDGDNLRHGLNSDLGFSAEERSENIRRIAETSRLMLDAGLIVLVSVIAPLAQDRALGRHLAGEHDFVEIFVDTPLELCEARDVKGLYAKARAGEIRDFTGIDAPYERPEAPELHLRGQTGSVDDLADEIEKYLNQRGLMHSLVDEGWSI
ncbi:bifunctional enzyme CysN/CysC [Pseudochrobactrum saccharolyticum]|uniref:Multifunctional fusion protein n=1 Tax=Pseudochrobactrum saccharolyticum TaxID=354352 RepID=A0A7W8AH07_9HYPH|nr:sulfate adenylyltransferase subunit CysN [Pseudochrobactrum saccharolyticum]KAB0540591.1 sulfate adenylyltransferase subunit CysN [Pseudochrobactrum saccharolyticum]MBB5090153.1 bifunctional enzyme CysN/CysC [Pseudochrobactrum saccharolyticum]